jgi:hypothetical protein
VGQNVAVDTDLTAIKAALAEVSDTELGALIAATYGVPQTAPGLMAWIEHACDWEEHRRRDFDFTLQPPEAGIDPSEDEASINAAFVLRDQFAQDSPAVRAFFDALGELRRGGSHHGGVSGGRRGAVRVALRAHFSAGPRLASTANFAGR